MPRYDYDCPKCGRHEQVLPAEEADFKRPCGACGKYIADFVWPAVNMQPDDMWAGKYVPAIGRSFDSKSRFKSHMKASGLEIADGGGVDSSYKQRREENLERKARPAREKVIAETVKSLT